MKDLKMKNFTSFFYLKNFIQFISCLFVSILLSVKDLRSQTIDKTKPVGSTSGSVNANGNGGATYTIPIEVPFGTNGIQPNLSLVYSSQAGDGIAGFGWNINAFSVISRAGKNVFHDGTAGPVNYRNSNDAFQLDGQHL